MHSFKETRIIKHDMDLIIGIITDIEKYPEFLPWCSSALILSKDDNATFAELKVSFKGFSESYVSKVSVVETPDTCIISTEAISGPFRYLKNNWHIRSLKGFSEVNFSIDFEFKSIMLDIITGTVFSIATKKMISAFEDRADSLSSRIWHY